MQSRATSRLFRVIGAAPDALVAIGCLWVWIAPRSVGVHWVKQVVVAMLVEFLAVHSGAFLASGFVMGDQPAWRRVAMCLGFGAIYLLFAGAFSFAFGTWWPLQAMAVLLAMKFWTVVFDREAGPREAARQGAIWAASAVLYLFGAFATIILPLPELGIDASVREAAELPGTGLWIEQPHRVIAFAAMYFALLAWIKYKIDSPSTMLGARGRS